MLSIFYLIVPLSALWVYWDATRNKIGIVRDEQGKRRKGTYSALELALTTLILWIYGFPAYIIKRKQLIQIAKDNPVESAKVKTFLKVFSILALIGLIACIFTFETTNSRLEKAAMPLVTQILNDQLMSNAECVDLRIGDKLAKNLYGAKAILNNGNTIKVTIHDKGEEIYVNIPLNQ